MEQNISYIVLGVVSRALGYIDSRLIGHGERVAYLCEKMLQCGGVTDAIDARVMLPLALLHDVGAYKTEDIDKMVVFETEDVTRHSVYGYLFLKKRSFLGDSAEAVLYHHTPYTHLYEIHSEHTLAAALIHICDRVDVLMVSGCDNPIAEISKKSGTTFDPALVSQLEECERRFSVVDKLKGSLWEKEFDEMKHDICLTQAEAFELVRMLVYAIDFRSECTVTHTAATVAFADGIARKMGFSDDEIKKIRAAAFLHDIGKIATPVEILEKPGRLTPDEMATMREHVIYSERIIRGVVPDEITDDAVRHHEKPNGSGYPHGHTADELTDAQCILAAADVMSALTGKRSYKEPFTKEQTLEIIQKMSDAGDLSPKICGVLSDSYDELMRAAEEVVNDTEKLYHEMKDEYAALSVKMKGKV